MQFQKSYGSLAFFITMMLIPLVFLVAVIMILVAIVLNSQVTFGEVELSYSLVFVAFLVVASSSIYIYPIVQFCKYSKTPIIIDGDMIIFEEKNSFRILDIMNMQPITKSAMFTWYPAFRYRGGEINFFMQGFMINVKYLKDPQQICAIIYDIMMRKRSEAYAKFQDHESGQANQVQQ